MNERDSRIWIKCLGDSEQSDSLVSRFAELIRADERRACAEIDFYEILRSSCNKEQSEELTELISSAIKAKGVTE
jgi:CRISPR/Cas system-associated protein Csm6